MATAGAHIKNIRENMEKEGQHISKALGSENLAEKKGKRGNPLEMMEETLRYEKYCKYWSILSNIAALISVSGAVFGAIRKKRFW